jgi:hypothetical protein
LLARLAVVDGSDPLASDHASAEALHQRLIALLDSREGDATIAGGTAVATLPRTSPTARLARLARAVFVRS